MGPPGPYGTGYTIGNVVSSIVAPLVLAALIVWIYEKARKRPMKRKTLVTVALWIVLFVLSTVGTQWGKV